MFIYQLAQYSQYDKLIPGICQLTANFETLLILLYIRQRQIKKKPDFLIRVRIRIRILESVLWFTNPDPALFGNDFERFFCLFLTVGTLTSVLLRSHGFC